MDSLKIGWNYELEQIMKRGNLWSWSKNYSHLRISKYMRICVVPYQAGMSENKSRCLRICSSRHYLFTLFTAIKSQKLNYTLYLKTTKGQSHLCHCTIYLYKLATPPPRLARHIAPTSYGWLAFSYPFLFRVWRYSASLRKINWEQMSHFLVWWAAVKADRFLPRCSFLFLHLLITFM